MQAMALVATSVRCHDWSFCLWKMQNAERSGMRAGSSKGPRQLVMVLGAGTAHCRLTHGFEVGVRHGLFRGQAFLIDVTFVALDS